MLEMCDFRGNMCRRTPSPTYIIQFIHIVNPIPTTYWFNLHAMYLMLVCSVKPSDQSVAARFFAMGTRQRGASSV